MQTRHVSSRGLLVRTRCKGYVLPVIACHLTITALASICIPHNSQVLQLLQEPLQHKQEAPCQQPSAHPSHTSCSRSPRGPQLM